MEKEHRWIDAYSWAMGLIGGGLMGQNHLLAGAIIAVFGFFIYDFHE